MIKIENTSIANIALDYVVRIKELQFRDKQFGNLFSNNIDDLILCSPSDFYDKSKLYDSQISGFRSAFTKYMIGQYERVMYDKGLGTWLTERLAVNVCPYCNRHYTFTVNRATKDTRPQLDHFYPKSKYPYFALSLYNLIPCCPECNRIKGDAELKINPYNSGFDNCRFSVDKIEEVILNADDKSKWSIVFENSTPDHEQHISLLALKNLYNGHKDYVEEIIFKATALNSERLSDVNDFLQLSNSKIDMSVAKRIIFGNYTVEKEYGKRPLSKLTTDILYQLKI